MNSLVGGLLLINVLLECEGYCRQFHDFEPRQNDEDLSWYAALLANTSSQREDFNALSGLTCISPTLTTVYGRRRPYPTVNYLSETSPSLYQPG